MSATVARQGVRVEWEQSNMRLDLNVAKIAKKDFSPAAMEEQQFLIRKPRAEVREEKKWGVEFPLLWKGEGCDRKAPGYAL